MSEIISSNSRKVERELDCIATTRIGQDQMILLKSLFLQIKIKYYLVAFSNTKGGNKKNLISIDLAINKFSTIAGFL